MGMEHQATGNRRGQKVANGYDRVACSESFCKISRNMSHV
ncbi:hypothetical protein FOQG_11111 [Fusarium oxysporum f. sp. raphani 54005]|uniref:Uncharacterized protein n=6 Tax=Fusarium oxysporum TaxID=5507 RepID=W9HLY6_FUSOX|nr:hypothetical protein FOYG_13430 [Fusarium oxysporum NRRL 32931]EXA36024.1 hypothetical protein FOVG_13141 [Fusarium oxysporum f. sp. pisi HDV247]EXK29159.1 hypothetical protein FOMG_14337 [Fusarium oxysporum f. sp. melonis 26406]EXK84876.1 hypothetical protein FOQG_11111 [Fusarium oxysporum f. sp. raphani 54005]EXL45651.1 hypothetical protein FOCG_13029 [Fusarium oxysporum f. sp. radicis-lycopersici 26381]EXL72050.1 hypothetical protein FOPG_12309 [Fusarium oxysporum f. sp. conglutinans rac